MEERLICVMLNFYGMEIVVAAIKNIAYFNEKDMSFVSLIFDIPLSEMLHKETIALGTLGFLKGLKIDVSSSLISLVKFVEISLKSS